MLTTEDRVAGIARKQTEVCAWSRILLLRGNSSGKAAARLIGFKGNTHFLLHFIFVGHFRTLHFEERHQERKRGFRSLVFIYAIGMKPVSAAACRWIVKRYLQVVLAKEPLEDPSASSRQCSSCVSPYASRQAEIVAQASTGC